MSDLIRKVKEAGCSDCDVVLVTLSELASGSGERDIASAAGFDLERIRKALKEAESLGYVSRTPTEFPHA